MGYIITTRNPRNNRLVLITDGDEDLICEFATEEEASEVAQTVPCCKAWSYNVVEIP